MAVQDLTPAEIKGFHDAAESLKLYRRADLTDAEQGTSLIEELYVDPLPEEQALRIMLRPNTTFIIGRKGTGKSTLFQRLQHELRRPTSQTSAYLDIKTIFESSQISPEILDKLSKLEGALPRPDLERILLYREFLKAVIDEIKSELRKRVEGSLWETIKDFLTEGVADLFEGLDAILEDSDTEKFISILGVRSAATAKTTGFATKTSAVEGLDITASKTPSASYKNQETTAQERTRTTDDRFSDILVRTFNIKDFLGRLKEVLAKLRIRTLYVLIDDFSELPAGAMKVVVDVLLAPLNNWSDEFVKFKVAAYPGRLYYGDIDKTKVDELYLDLSDLYGTSDVSKMEESAIDFTRRLVERRIKHFCKCSPDHFFDADPADIWRLLFFATMANPRNLGWILTYLHESHLIYSKRIGTEAIRAAARRYYEEKLEYYFKHGKFLHEAFEERSSIFSLKELLERLVARARELRYHKSGMMQKISGRPPTSHFHVIDSFESLLSTLELNFFVTRYFHMADRDSRKVTVYALNYGLCQKFNVEFGRPIGEREFRLYFVERFFNSTPILEAYIKENQEIICDDCGTRYSFENLEALKFFGMKCKECSTGTCKVINLSKKYEKELRAVNEALLLPKTELGMLQTLHTEDKPLRATVIAGELDCSYQLIGKRGKNLAERGLVERSRNEEGKRIFEITEQGEKTYFDAATPSALDVPDAEPEQSEVRQQ